MRSNQRLERTLVDSSHNSAKLAEIAARFAGAGLSEPLAELHGQTIEPMSLGT